MCSAARNTPSGAYCAKPQFRLKCCANATAQQLINALVYAVPGTGWFKQKKKEIVLATNAAWNSFSNVTYLVSF